VAELCALKWNNVQPNGESGQISVFGKGGKTRWIVLPPSLWQVLITFRGESPDTAPIFPSRKHGGHLDSSQVLRIVRAAAKRAGIPKNVSPHCSDIAMRHTHCIEDHSSTLWQRRSVTMTCRYRRYVCMRVRTSRRESIWRFRRAVAHQRTPDYVFLHQTRLVA
jgi:integrase